MSSPLSFSTVLHKKEPFARLTGSSASEAKGTWGGERAVGKKENNKKNPLSEEQC